MPVAYPLSLRTLVLSGKARSQPAAFRMATPRRGLGYAQAGGAGAPRIFSATFRFTQAEASSFLWWFATDLERGTLEFTLPIVTEAGTEELTCRFAPGSLLDTTETGEVFTYTAQIIATDYVAPPVDWPVLPEVDVPAYPLDLRTIIRASKTRTQAAPFTMSDPRAGLPYTQTSGFDTPTIWAVEFRFTAAEAATFQDWFRDDIQLGVLAFTMPIRTEFGVLTYGCRFLPDGLLDARQDGDVWTYSARIAAREMTIVDTRVIEVFDTPGVHAWTPPVGAVRFEVRALGAGGGGGGGSHTAASSSPCGGGGGGGGGYIAADLAANPGPQSITVGAGGTGGVGASGGTATGGTTGGNSSFGTLVVAYGGGGGGAGGNGSAVGAGGGGAGTTAAGSAGPNRSVYPGIGGVGGATGGGTGGTATTPGVTVSEESPGAGGGGGSQQGTEGGSSVRGGAGGGGGSASGSSNNAAALAGASGGATLLVATVTPGGVKNVIGDNGTDPADLEECSAGSAGGGGGGSGSNIAGVNTGLAGDGGAAGRGSGGGGGGGVYASNSAHTGGGGAGGDGIVVVISYL